MKISRVAALVISTLIGGACKDSPTGPPAVATIALTVPNSSPVAGTSQTLLATPRGSNGTELRDRTVAWNSSNTFVATVNTRGELTAVAPGTSTVTASIDGKSASAAITVLPPPVATVTIVSEPDPIVVGTTRLLIALLRDASGAPLNGRQVAWSSSSPAIASVTADGVLTGILPGTVTITATSEGQTATSAHTIVAPPEAPIITSISQTQLVPGTTATIVGIGFSTNPQNNRVTVRGVDAAVLSATATQLAITVPCVNSGAAAITVAANGRASAAVSRPVVVAARTIAVGQALVLSSSSASACNELITTSPNARYLIAVFSASTSANTLINVEIAGNTTGAVGMASASAVVRQSVNQALRPTQDELRESAQDSAHWKHLERERTNYNRVGVAARTTRASSRIRQQADVPAVGDTREFYYTFNSGCTDTSRPMQTKAVYVGTRSIIWEDSANVLLSTNNADLAGYYQRLGQIFDQDQYQSLKNTFGDPLLRDTLTDNDGRVHMVFTQRLNGSGAAAFVTFCDQLPRTTNPGSNFGEVFYGSVPTIAGSGLTSTNFPDGWFYFMARTVVHEVKHIVSLAARVQNNAPVLESSWLEEGTARHAEEVWVRESLHHVPWKGNTGFGNAGTNGIFCDFHPLDATCNAADALRRPSYGMRRQFNEIREKLLAPWDWSPYGEGTGQSGSVFYQTAWSLVRYTIDRYAASDAAFFRTLLNSSTNGTANLATTAGVPLDQLIGGWGLALFADDYPGLISPTADLQFPTWNLRSIYAGLNASPNWAGRFPNTFPIQPVQLAFGTFAMLQSGLRGGAHAYYELSGASIATQLIQLRSSTGGLPSANARIAIARLQ
ncbi:MAG: Ig-like domain-containing protein [Phycisphaerae bacterium]|nr:Ig-like domain-containing protein [Gemmatimonadaceae bacterium]